MHSENINNVIKIHQNLTTRLYRSKLVNTLLGRQNTDSSVTICSTKCSSDWKSGNWAMSMPTYRKRKKYEFQHLCNSAFIHLFYQSIKQESPKNNADTGSFTKLSYVYKLVSIRYTTVIAFTVNMINLRL